MAEQSIRSYTVVLSTDALLSSAEAITSMYIAVVNGVPCDMIALALVRNYAEGLEGALVELLRAPLRDREFSRAFFKFFERHPIEDIRTIGYPWLEEVLHFES